MSGTTLKDKLIGCIDLFLFFPRGINAFVGEKRTAIRAFIIVNALLFPLIPITAAMVPPVGMEGQNYPFILKIVLLHDLITMVAGLWITWLIAGLLEKQHRFWLGLEASAWCNLLFTTVVMIPLLILDHNDMVPDATMQRTYTILACYAYVFGGTVLYAVYRVNIFLILAWSILGFGIDRETWNILYALHGLPQLP